MVAQPIGKSLQHISIDLAVASYAKHIPLDIVCCHDKGFEIEGVDPERRLEDRSDVKGLGSGFWNAKPRSDNGENDLMEIGWAQYHIGLLCKRKRRCELALWDFGIKFRGVQFQTGWTVVVPYISYSQPQTSNGTRIC
jgi:hypothetical protein